MHVNTIGVDLAKNVFQVHGVDCAGKIVITRQLRRKQVLEFFSKLPGCLVGMRPAEPVIIGLVKSPSSVTPFA
jgi:transposase